MRILGGLNVLAALLGIWYAATMIQMHWGRWPGNPNHSQWAVFLGLSAISFFLIVYLAYLGVKLIRGDTKALWKVALILVVEMVYFFIQTTITWLILPESMSKIAVGFYGMAEDPIAPQIVTGYSLIGLIAAVTLWVIAQRRPSESRTG
jgi:hypothetical protein